MPGNMDSALDCHVIAEGKVDQARDIRINPTTYSA